MSHAPKLLLLLAILLSAQRTIAQSSTPTGNARAVVLEKNEGELRTRRPRDTPMASSDFLVKVSPKTTNSKHLLVGAEEIPPGSMIPRHKHHGEEEILLIQTGKAHVWLGDKEYDALPGALVFIPSETWISLKNTGTENINLLFVFNEPSFEEMLRCASVPKGQPAPPLSRDEVKACYRHGDAELEVR
jgi:mannose-6-phosphate isomerase-like protein (cupin superfamily)